MNVTPLFSDYDGGECARDTIRSSVRIIQLIACNEESTSFEAALIQEGILKQIKEDIAKSPCLLTIVTVALAQDGW